MTCGKWASSDSLTRNKGGFTNSVFENCPITRDVSDEETSIFDEDILMMTDAEKEAFAEMQNRLEEQRLSQFYHRHYQYDSFPSVDSENNEDVLGGNLDYIEDNNKHRRSNSVNIRLESSKFGSSGRPSHRRSRSNISEDCGVLVYSSARRSREREAWYMNMIDDELTFHPQINPTNVASRYMTDVTRRIEKNKLDVNKAEDIDFKPVVNRLHISSFSDHLNRYLRTPVYRRLGQTTPVSAPSSSRRIGQQQQTHERHRQANVSRRNSRERQPTEAFLQRLEETNRRRERNLQRIALAQEGELTFRPKLAPGTRQRRVVSAVSAHIHGQRAANRTSSGPGASLSRVEETKKDVASVPEGCKPHINARSRTMKRSTEDLRLFEQRRQQRLRQMQAEKEAAERKKFSGTPTVSMGSLKLVKSLFGDDVTHEAIQEYMQRHARMRAAAVRAEHEAMQEEKKKELTFCPEVHQVPPYLHDIAQELAVNKTFAVKPPRPKPSFRFS